MHRILRKSLSYLIKVIYCHEKHLDALFYVEMVTRIFDELYDGQRVFPLTEIVQLCRSNPIIPAINSDVMQKAGLPIKIKDASADD